MANGDSSQALVPVVPKVEEPEERYVALQAIKLSFLEDAVAHAPQYHWHTRGTSGIDEEARERLVALKALVNCSSEQTEEQEEVLASCMDAEGATKAQGLTEFQEF